MRLRSPPNSARFGQLDDHYILDEVTVYFDNGKVNVDPKYVQPLMELVQKAKTCNGYNIQVKGKPPLWAAPP